MLIVLVLLSIFLFGCGSSPTEPPSIAPDPLPLPPPCGSQALSVPVYKDEGGRIVVYNPYPNCDVLGQLLRDVNGRWISSTNYGVQNGPTDSFIFFKSRFAGTRVKIRLCYFDSHDRPISCSPFTDEKVF